MKLVRITATAAAVVAAATLAQGVTHAEGAPPLGMGSYPQGPTRYTDSGVPEYGVVGQGVWQEAAIVNMGDPSIRIIYDQTVPGAHDRAMSDYYQLAAAMSSDSQPGVTTDLHEVAHTAYYDGVQLQLFDHNSAGAQWADPQYIKLLATYGITFIPE
jgi:hypothetical protein